jgi:hypothetical protein
VNLKLVDTQDLLMELASRFENSVFLGVKDLNGDKEVRKRLFRGSPYVLSGLALELSIDVLKRSNRPAEEGEEWG